MVSVTCMSVSISTIRCALFLPRLTSVLKIKAMDGNELLISIHARKMM